MLLAGMELQDLPTNAMSFTTAMSASCSPLFRVSIRFVALVRSTVKLAFFTQIHACYEHGLRSGGVCRSKNCEKGREQRRASSQASQQRPKPITKTCDMLSRR